MTVKEWLIINTDGKPSDVIKLLNRKLVEQYRYYGISPNYEELLKIYRFMLAALYERLILRSQRAYLSWKRYKSLLKKHLIMESKINVDIWQALQELYEEPVALIEHDGNRDGHRPRDHALCRPVRWDATPE